MKKNNGKTLRNFQGGSKYVFLHSFAVEMERKGREKCGQWREMSFCR